MIIEEDGPFNIFMKFNNMIIMTRIQWLNKLFTCFYCLSVWVGVIVSMIVYTSVKDILLYGLACSALAILYNKVIDK